MTLTDSIATCTRLASLATTQEECDRYIAELAGLHGEPLAESLAIYQHAYMMGVERRRLLETIEAAGLVE